MHHPRAAAALLVGALGLSLTACGTPDTSPSHAVSPTASASDRPSTAAESASASVTPSASPRVSATPPPVALEAVTEGLSSPIGIAPAPAGWIIVNEQAGRAVAVDPASGETVTTLDIRDRVGSGGERGLLGLVLHPDWPRDDRAFVHYSDADGNTVLSEFTGSQDGDSAPVLDPESETVLLTAQQPFPNHNGGQVAFGPDGYLWMALGDGGAGGDPMGNGQDPTTLLGSILRLDVSARGSYAIPEDNPFADGAGGAPEVYLYGLRNPWRFSFDNQTGALWVADVGQGAREEVNRLDPTAGGANLGWNVMEGSACYEAAECATDGLVLPVAEYGHDIGCSVTGGAVYRGDAIEDLVGWYLMSDYCSGLLFGVRSDTPSNAVAEPLVMLETGARVSSIGADEGGELYLTDLSSGTLYRIVSGG